MAIDTTVVNIDFEVSRSNSCKSLKVWDLSHWANAVDDAAYIEITTPGQVKPIVHVFQKEKVNVFNIVNLNLSDIIDYSSLTSIPDGIYKLKVLQCSDDPYAVTHYHLQDCQIRCSIAKKLIAIDLTCNPCREELLENIQEIMLFLEGARAQTDNCNVNKAMEYYRRAQTLLTRITDNPANCNC